MSLPQGSEATCPADPKKGHPPAASVGQAGEDIPGLQAEHRVAMCVGHVGVMFVPRVAAIDWFQILMFWRKVPDRSRCTAESKQMGFLGLGLLPVRPFNASILQ